jgi:hypothetical protein
VNQGNATEFQRSLERCLVFLEEEEVVTPNRHTSFVCVGLAIGEDVGGLVDGAPCTLCGACKVVALFFRSTWSSF